MTKDYLKEFEELNTTTRSIYDLEEFDVLIILKDGTNLTSWNNVKREDVIYISEDLSNITNVTRRYAGFRYLRAIIAFGLNSHVEYTISMFEGCAYLRFSLFIVLFLLLGRSTLKSGH